MVCSVTSLEECWVPVPGEGWHRSVGVSSGVGGVSDNTKCVQHCVLPVRGHLSRTYGGEGWEGGLAVAVVW